MRRCLRRTALGVTLSLACVGSALGQGQVEVSTTTPAPGPRLEIVPQGPATRETTRPNDADLYPDGVRVRHEPAFIEPFATRTEAGNEVGLSGWTAPATPVGSLASQGYYQNNGWFAIGISFTFDAPPRPTTRPASAPR
jgi:hypothetical protein